ncbi:hypothetical protein HDV62DRAFT_133525 [Trichoderma sp. SZMC 28011]
MSKHGLLRTRTLESLNSDVLIRILSAFDSFSDLASVIRASPASPASLHAFLCRRQPCSCTSPATLSDRQLGTLPN